MFWPAVRFRVRVGQKFWVRVEYQVLAGPWCQCRHSSSIWFCPLFCPLPHLPYILPSFFALALALFFVEGKGKGKKWGQNIGQIWKRAKLRANLEGKNVNLSEIIYELLKLQHKSHRIDLNWLYLSNIHLIHTFTFQVWEEKCSSIEQIGQNWKCTKSASDVLWN